MLGREPWLTMGMAFNCLSFPLVSPGSWVLLLQRFKKSENVLDFFFLPFSEYFSYFLGLLVWKDVCPSLHFGYILFFFFGFLSYFSSLFFFFLPPGERADSNEKEKKGHRLIRRQNGIETGISLAVEELSVWVCLSVIFLRGQEGVWGGGSWAWRFRLDSHSPVKVGILGGGEKGVCECVCACACALLFGSVTRESSSSAFHLFILMI